MSEDNGKVSSPEIGQDGMGSESYTKYEAAKAPVTKYGGNDAIQDGIVTEQKDNGAKVDATSPGFGE